MLAQYPLSRSLTARVAQIVLAMLLLPGVLLAHAQGSEGALAADK